MTTALHPALPSSAIRGQGLPLVAGGGMAGLGADRPQVVTKPLTLQDDFVVQSLSCVQLFGTAWTAACQASLSFTISWSLLELMSIELVMPSNRLTLCCPLLLLRSVFPSIRVFLNESALGSWNPWVEQVDGLQNLHCGAESCP